VAAARNILIVMVLALGVAFLPNGGDFADAVLTAITMAFLAGIAWTVYRLHFTFRTGLLSLPDSRRIVLYGALGVIVLLVAGADRMFGTGLGTLAWLLLMGASLAGIWLVVSEARGY